MFPIVREIQLCKWDSGIIMLLHCVRYDANINRDFRLQDVHKTFIKGLYFHGRAKSIYRLPQLPHVIFNSQVKGAF